LRRLANKILTTSVRKYEIIRVPKKSKNLLGFASKFGPTTIIIHNQNTKTPTFIKLSKKPFTNNCK
jgi:hypothetical protein